MSSLHLPRIRDWILQSPPGEWVLGQVRELLIGALKQGPIPQHVAFVMDGNRRFARTHQIETIEGHNLGFEALAKVLEVCYKAGVKVVTIYAFSVENFKRSKHEVGALMEMAKLKLSQLSQHGELLNRYGACIRILGQRDLIRPDVLEAVNEAVNLTKHNKRAVLNICFPYTSRDEITTAIRSTVSEYSHPLSKPPTSARTFSENHITRSIRSQRLSTLKEESSSNESRSPSPLPGQQAHEYQQHSRPSSPSSSSVTLNHETSPNSSHPHSPEPALANSKTLYRDPETITADTLTDHMYTAGTPPLDLLVRTSGVERLSDFMLWQCHENTSIYFLKCLWPEFDLWHFLPVLVEWQWWRRKQNESASRGLGPGLRMKLS